ncbi:MAG: glycosyltransferase family 2 protein [Ignavibacteriaceae bacterium]|nr:glycosyltransferase family 2 protein [Ignavibacteriaceae bacterium]
MNHFSESNTALVIPFYNERRFLPLLFSRIPANIAGIIFIDDGSSDGSAEVIPRNDSRIFLLSHSENRGKGAALRTGMLKSLESGFSATITLDADLQHPPEIVPDLVNLLNLHQVVIGTRNFTFAEMPFERVLSNIITSLIISRKSGKRIKDSQSGYRAFRNDILRQILPESDDYIAESEMLIKAGRLNLNLGELPIPALYGEETSKINNRQVIWGFIRKIIFRRKFL